MMITYQFTLQEWDRTTLDGTRLISQQPYLGSMFKSQNGSTWTPEQNEDVKFNINRAKFTDKYTMVLFILLMMLYLY